jgi:hypothetical protein
MHISGKEVERLVREGGTVKVDYWAYDLFAERLEKMGFRRTGKDSFSGFAGSTYRNERADEVMVATRRLGQPLTVVMSTPFSEKDSN